MYIIAAHTTTHQPSICAFCSSGTELPLPEPSESPCRRLLHLGNAPRRATSCVSEVRAGERQGMKNLPLWERGQESPAAAQPGELPVAPCQPDTYTGKA